MHPSLIVVGKDLRRLWPAALALVLIQAFFDLALEAFARNGILSDSLAGLVLSQGTLNRVAVFGLMFGVVVALFWSDPAGDPAAAWRTRPVTGLQLLGGKALGVAALVWLPFLCVGLVWWLWNGFGADLVVEQVLETSRQVVVISVLAATGAMFSRRWLGLLVSVCAMLAVGSLAMEGIGALYWKFGHRAMDGALARAWLLPVVVGLGAAQMAWHARSGRSRLRALLWGMLPAAVVLVASSLERPLGETWQTGSVTVVAPTWGGDVMSTTLSLKIGGLGPRQFAWAAVSGRFPGLETTCTLPRYPGNWWTLIEQALAKGTPTTVGADRVVVGVTDPAVLPYQKLGDLDRLALQRPVVVDLPRFEGVAEGRLLALEVSPAASFSSDEGLRQAGCSVLVGAVSVSNAEDRIEFRYSLTAPATRYRTRDIYVVDRGTGGAYPVSTLEREHIGEAGGLLAESGRFYVPLSRMHPGPFASEQEKLHWVRSLSVVTVARRDLGWFSRRFVVPPQRLTVPPLSQAERLRRLSGPGLPGETTKPATLSSRTNR